MSSSSHEPSQKKQQEEEEGNRSSSFFRSFAAVAASASSNGARNLQMDYDDIIDSNSQLADKGKDHLNVGEHQGVLPRFELSEDLEVHLGFEESWGSHFSREESNVLGIEASSQNLDFSSTTAKASTVNVWSEATSTESVQMLLNSVGHEENVNGDSEKPEIESKNEVEGNTSNIESTTTVVEIVGNVEHKTETNRQHIERMPMDAKEEFDSSSPLEISKNGSVPCSDSNKEVKIENSESVDMDIDKAVPQGPSPTVSNAGNNSGEQRDVSESDGLPLCKKSYPDKGDGSTKKEMEIDKSLEEKSPELHGQKTEPTKKKDSVEATKKQKVWSSETSGGISHVGEVNGKEQTVVSGKSIEATENEVMARIDSSLSEDQKFTENVAVSSKEECSLPKQARTDNVSLVRSDSVLVTNDAMKSKDNKHVAVEQNDMEVDHNKNALSDVSYEDVIMAEKQEKANAEGENLDHQNAPNTENPMTSEENIKETHKNVGVMQNLDRKVQSNKEESKTDNSSKTLQITVESKTQLEECVDKQSASFDEQGHILGQGQGQEPQISSLEKTEEHSAHEQAKKDDDSKGESFPLKEESETTPSSNFVGVNDSAKNTSDKSNNIVSSGSEEGNKVHEKQPSEEREARLHISQKEGAKVARKAGDEGVHAVSEKGPGLSSNLSGKEISQKEQSDDQTLQTIVVEIKDEEHGNNKEGIVEENIGKTSSQSGDTFTFDTVADKNISVEFPTSGQQNVSGCWKPFETCSSSEVTKQADSVRPVEAGAKDAQRNSDHKLNENVEASKSSGLLEGKSGAGAAKKVEKRSGIPEDSKSGPESSKVSDTRDMPEKQSTRRGTKHDRKDSISSSPVISTQETCSVPTSSLPDLNTAAPPNSVPFYQPFTDAQQVQLRAQILVYGSLIQGSLPEEDLMITAFADIRASQNGASTADVSRGPWETTWRVAADRMQRKMFSAATSCPSTPATASSKVSESMKSPSAAPAINAGDGRSSVSVIRSTDVAASRAPNLTTRMSGTTNMGRAGNNKNPMPPIMASPPNVTIPSPVWSMPTAVDGSMARNLHMDPHQIAAARHMYQPPQFGHYAPAAGTGRLSALPLPVPWVAASQGTIVDSNIQLSNFAVTEVGHDMLNNRRTTASSSSPYTPKMPVISHYGNKGSTSASKVSTDASKVSLPGGRSEQKSGKRKKKSVSTDLASSATLATTNGLTQPSNGLSKVSSDLVPATSVGPSMMLTSNTTPYSSSVPSSSLGVGSHYQVISKADTGQKVVFSEETASRIEQARLNAEDAASSASNALIHSQGIWNQLASQKESGSVSDCEAKLASAAVAAAAAASVAKAAAAAARLACDVALQSKLMANEALSSDGKGAAAGSAEMCLYDGSHGQSHSIIAAAKEAAKKRIESVAAAAKRAENVDAVVRAAELAAQAVSEAGAVAAMGDPIPLSLNELLEAGPEGYWKLVNRETVPRQDETNNKALAIPGKGTGAEDVNRANEKGTKPSKSKDRKDTPRKELSKDFAGEISKQAKDSYQEVLKQGRESMKAIHSAPHIVSTVRDVEGQSESEIHGRPQPIAVSSDIQSTSREEATGSHGDPNGKRRREALPLKSSEIKEDSLVEVVSDEEGLRGVWFAAKVLSLNDGKAHVQYDELLADDGVSQLEEWIPLEGLNGNAPRIRMAHPMTVMKFEGTRKRRRDAMGNHAWELGDRVDAWMRDGWWEGIIIAKNDSDESKLTVNFPGEGDTSVIKAWNLRPSLIWKDGQWIEWTLLKAQKGAAVEVEMPIQKRQKVETLDSLGEAKGREKPQRIPNIEEAKKVQELNTVFSSCKDRSLMHSKSSADDRAPGTVKVNNMALLKEGSKVVFGVPKATKKRKFMDVSKHYVVDPSARNTVDSKLAKTDKQKTSVVTNSHNGWKPTGAKIDEKTAKKLLIPKYKDPKVSKNQEDQTKMKFDKDKNPPSQAVLVRDSSNRDIGLPLVPTSAMDAARSSRTGGLEANAPGNETSGEATVPSGLKESTSRRSSPSRAGKIVAAEPEQGSKLKQASVLDCPTHAEKNIIASEVTGDEVAEKAPGDKVEPRRSNRRIQPTSRLLEGLQTSSSLIKNTGHFSHDRGGKSHSKGSAVKGNYH